MSFRSHSQFNIPVSSGPMRGYHQPEAAPNYGNTGLSFIEKFERFSSKTEEKVDEVFGPIKQ